MIPGEDGQSAGALNVRPSAGLFVRPPHATVAMVPNSASAAMPYRKILMERASSRLLATASYEAMRAHRSPMRSIYSRVSAYGGTPRYRATAAGPALYAASAASYGIVVDAGVGAHVTSEQIRRRIDRCERIPRVDPLARGGIRFELRDADRPGARDDARIVGRFLKQRRAQKLDRQSIAARGVSRSRPRAAARRLARFADSYAESLARALARANRPAARREAASRLLSHRRRAAPANLTRS